MSQTTTKQHGMVAIAFRSAPWALGTALSGLPTAIAAAHGSGASIIHVDDSAPPGGDGASWATAFAFLADALDSIDPDQDGGEPQPVEIRVAEGQHRPDRSTAFPRGSGDVTATFKVHPGLALRGGYAGLGARDPDAQDPEAHPTILDGDLLGDDTDGLFDDNAHHVVTVKGDGTIVDGFHIRGGVGGVIDDTGNEVGGGIVCDGWALTVTRCALTHNHALYGAAIYVRTTNQVGKQAVVTDCLVADNVATLGAIRVRDASASIKRCIVRDNSTIVGGGILGFATDAQRTISTGDCVFEDNTALDGAGAVSVSGAMRYFADGTRFAGNRGNEAGAVVLRLAPSHLTRCAVLDNDGGVYGAGGVNLSDDDGGGGGLVQMRNCVVAGNSTPGMGGGARQDTWVRWVNCVLSHNIAFFGGGAIYSEAKTELDCSTIASCGPSAVMFAGTGEDMVRNCIVSSAAPAIVDVAGLATVQSSLVSGGWTGPGSAVIDDDPLFVAEDARDLRLAAGSPAIDAGSAALLPFDNGDLDGNGQPNTLSVDLLDQPRVQGAAPDLGAIEGAFAAMAATSSADDVAAGATVHLSPVDNRLWAPPPVEASFLNLGPASVDVALAQIGWTNHRGAGGFTEEGLVAALSTSAPDGGQRTRIVIPFSMAAQPFDAVMELRPTRFDPALNAWRLGVVANIAVESGDVPIGRFFFATGDIASPPTFSAALGDHGVFFDTLRRRGVAWANVNVAGEYGLGRNVNPADIVPANGDGIVDGADLGELLSTWGGPGAGDIDGSGTVDSADLGLLLQAWGT